MVWFGFIENCLCNLVWFGWFNIFSYKYGIICGVVEGFLIVLENIRLCFGFVFDLGLVFVENYYYISFDFWVCKWNFDLIFLGYIGIIEMKDEI